MIKDLLDRARRAAEEHLPADVVDAGRKLGRSVAEYVPAPLAEMIQYATREDDEVTVAQARAAAEAAGLDPDAKAGASTIEVTGWGSADGGKDGSPGADAAEDSAEARASDGSSEASSKSPSDEPHQASASEGGRKDADEPRREDPSAVLARVKAKADKGLKPEDRLVVVYATPDEEEDVAEILEILKTVEAEIRENDLRREPQTARQLAKLTGVMVPPYVFINGRFWGARYELEALAASGDLPLVVANRLDEIGDEARRIGHLQESFSDEISVANILERWRLGHILCVDDLDSWYEVERDGTERFYYMGGPRPVEDMQAVAEEIVRGVQAEDFEATWQLEPSVHLP